MEPQPQATPGDLQLGLQKGSDPRPPSFQLLLAGVISGSFPLGEQLRLQAEAVAACPGPVRHQPPLLASALLAGIRPGVPSILYPFLEPLWIRR